ncbi:flagellar hook-basal body complex protein FliE [Candidatus Paracaedibacter symbiosus]|uniref:flagellar hook-basal body complex protein FliE n=1 Tax=Candidatus Paracaedibacter symbiosus TaxID=244582 RepID=UPI000509BEC1|nr:flagellar hook-basal body complex protein FliE [Candidatus Paracaedibacter symbiosus]
MALMNPIAGINSYQKIMGMGGIGPAGSEAAIAAPAFEEVLKKTLTQTAEAAREHEALAIQYTIGEADMAQVVRGAAELDVKASTAVALRDKLTALIQELEKMQI